MKLSILSLRVFCFFFLNVIHFNSSSSSSSSSSLYLTTFPLSPFQDFDYSSRSSTHDEIIRKYAEIVPHKYYGPSSLRFLDGACFKKVASRFEYNVCPFQNITNRRVSSQRSSLIGKWKVN